MRTDGGEVAYLVKRMLSEKTAAKSRDMWDMDGWAFSKRTWRGVREEGGAERRATDLVGDFDGAGDAGVWMGSCAGQGGEGLTAGALLDERDVVRRREERRTCVDPGGRWTWLCDGGREERAIWQRI